MPQMAPCHGTATCGAGIGPGPRRVAARLLRTTLLLFALSAAPAHADFQAGAAAYARGDYKTAIDEWLPYAANGDPRALFNLGQMYRLGLGADKDLVKAEQYYRRAAEMGHVGAQANLGSMLYDRTPRQGTEAVAFWRQAARGGDAKSQYLLGVQFFNGEFVTRDYVQAYAWLSLASNAGIREAAEALATTRSYLEAPAIEEAIRLADTLVTPPAQATAAPGIRTRAEPDAAQLDGAVLRHAVDDLVTADLSPISPNAVQGAIPIPLRDETQPVAAAAPAAASAPVKSADPRDAEYRAQFASFPTEREASDLRRTLADKYARLLGDAGVEVERLDGGGPQPAVYRVRTGPLKGEAAAKALCASVEADAISCQPAKSIRVSVAGKQEPEAPPAPAPIAPQVTPPAPAVPPPAATQQTAEQPKPEAEPEPRAEHGGDNWRVQVGAGRTEEEARFRWARLMGANADLLDAAELYIFKADLGPKGVFYRVQIGGFGTRPAAIGLCERLKARKVDCFVTATRQ